MSDSFEKLCKRISVRIAVNGGTQLIGSGTILASELNNYALIFTAAHVLDYVYNNTSDNKVHFCFSMANDVQKNTVLELKRGEALTEICEDDIGYSYVHPEYVPGNEDYPQNDGAIICIRYCEWMKGLPSFQICECKLDKADLVGFPQKREADIKDWNIKLAALRDGIFHKKVSIENHHLPNIVVNNVCSDSIDSADYDLDGLSGGGVFTESAKGLAFNGAFVSTRVEDKDTYYATNATVFREIMDKYGIRVSMSPHNFERILDGAKDHFHIIIHDKARRWLSKKTVEYLGENCSQLFSSNDFANSDLLPCESYRPLCLQYYYGKLIGTVLMGVVYELDSSSIGNQIIRIGEPETDVHLEYICSEKAIYQIVTEIIKSGAFSSEGPFYNGSIFIINSMNDEKPSELLNRFMCRNIIPSIVYSNIGEWGSCEKFSLLVGSLLSEEHKENENYLFSAILGDLNQANIGFIGIGELEKAMKLTGCKEKSLGSRVKKLIEDVWSEEEV